MPALPSPGKVVRCIFGYTDGSNAFVQNKMYYSYTGSVSSTDCTTVANDLATAWNTNMAPLVTTNFELTSIEVTDLDTATGAQVTQPYTHAGGNAGTKMPSATCFVIKGIISRRYRGGHQRVYLTGFPESFLASANTWATTNAASIVTAWAAIVSSVESSPPADLGTVAAVQVGYYSGFTVITNPITGRTRNVPKLLATPHVDVINSYVNNPKVCSQRRRNQQSR